MNPPILMQFQDQPFNGDSYVCNQFLKLKDDYSINIAVETGSCMYTTTEWLGKNFKQVYTIEINPEFAKYGFHKIENLNNVTPSLGNSIDFINHLVTNLHQTDRVLFFLDAHWGDVCPLLGELESISNIKTDFPPIIVIHDFFTGDPELGWDEYNGQVFNWSWIEPSIKKIESKLNCNYTYFYNTQSEGAKRGVIYITPQMK
jgi:hypothetical protein